jgi:hypothetical protein
MRDPGGPQAGSSLSSDIQKNSNNLTIPVYAINLNPFLQNMKLF